MTLGGWIIMIVSCGFATGLLGWCIYRVTRESSPTKVHMPQSVDTHDTND